MKDLFSIAFAASIAIGAFYLITDHPRQCEPSRNGVVGLFAPSLLCE